MRIRAQSLCISHTKTKIIWMMCRYYSALSQVLSHYFNQQPPHRYTQFHLRTKVPAACKYHYLMCWLLWVLHLIKPATVSQRQSLKEKSVTQVRRCSRFILVKAHDGKEAEPDQPQHKDGHPQRAADASRLDISQHTCTWSVWGQHLPNM